MWLQEKVPETSLPMCLLKAPGIETELNEKEGESGATFFLHIILISHKEGHVDIKGTGGGLLSGSVC